ncbi:DsbA family protein [Candidatus Woesearchaeota archaeon]|nr:DsbA family protein [Candidatus Woesearchaeota archaeon]
MDIHPKKEETYTLTKTTVWKGLSGGLLILLVISLFTGGFGLGKDSAQPTILPTQPTQEREQAQQVLSKVNLEGAAVKGDEDAEVIIVEYSDFQCPFCGRFYSSTLPEVEKNFVDTGKVRFAYKHFPLPFHTEADEAAESSECAKEQKKFWEMHDWIFTNSALWIGKSGDSLKQVFVDGASSVGLDASKFESCYDSGKYRSIVQQHAAEGNKDGVSGTPTFLIGNEEDGYTQVVGAQPYSVLEQVINAAL